MDTTNGYLSGLSDGPGPCVGDGCCSDCFGPRACQDCDGTGEDESREGGPRVCPTCNGEG